MSQKILIDIIITFTSWQSGVLTLMCFYPTHDGRDSSKNNWDGPLYCENGFHSRDEGVRQPYYVRIGALELDVLQLSHEKTNSSKFMIG
jgi:hypothetical protein